MVLLIYHYDKHNSNSEQFLNQEIRLDLGFYPKANTYIKLRQLAYSVNSKGGRIHLNFPDLIDNSLTVEEKDASNLWEMEGIVFSNRTGEYDNAGTGDYDSSSDHYDLNLNLGIMDTQKDYFSIIVNGRRADVESSTLNNLSSITIVLEMSHHNRHT